MTPIPITPTLVTALIFSLAPLVGIASDEVVAADLHGVTIDYKPEFGQTWTDPDGNLQLPLQDGTLDLRSGEPELPYRILAVAVPPGSRPTYRIIEWEAGETIDGHFAMHRNDAEGEATIFAAPKKRADSIEIRSMLGLAIARIPLFPVEIDGSTDQVNIARRMTIRVDFNAPVKTASSRPPRITRLHRLLIPNADQAASWGRFKTSDFQVANWPQGYLYRFDLEEEGIFKLSFEDLRSGGVDLNPTGVPSGQVKLFGNSGTELPLAPESQAPIGLLECAIYVDDGNDGVFGPGDWLAFYGRGAGGFVVDSSGVDYSLNHYVLRNQYWFNIDPNTADGGKRMAPFSVDELPDRTVERASNRFHFEPEKFIYGGSSFPGAGRDWYGFAFESISRISYTVNLPAAIAGEPGTLTARIVRADTGLNPNIKVKINGVDIGQFAAPNYWDYAVSERNLEIPAGILQPGANNFSFEQTLATNSRAMFDWFEIVHTVNLNQTTAFESIPSADVVSYGSQLAEPWFFEISDPANVGLERETMQLRGNNPRYRRLMVTTPSDFRRISPRFVSYTPPEEDIPDLLLASNSYDLLMIVPDNYYDASIPLNEHYARRDPPLRAARIRLSEIYNRFSGGLRDPAAIRNLLHYAKDNWAAAPQYIVFCGDGDYNYRDLDRPANPDFLPPYESDYDKGVVCSDDWFVDFSPGGRDLLPEMAHGRLPANSPRELEGIANKIVAYDEEPEFGLWRSRVTLAADDEFSETSSREFMHVSFSEDLATRILPDWIECIKVYETEYQRQWGREKPLASDALLNSINDGTLIVNYMGHGNPTLWAHERLFVLNRDLARIKPSRRLPLFIAFTCDWAYWDDPIAQSFSEQLVTKPDGGAIGAIASTRLTYSTPNETLSEWFYTYQFNEDNLTSGEALWRAKHTGFGTASSTYHLLGDPSLRLAMPMRRGAFSSLTPIPLQVLGQASVAGHANNDAGGIDDEFNGDVIFVLRDSSIPREYVIGEDEGSITLNYTLPGATAYRGFLSLENGRFDGDFIVPRDVTLGGEKGRAFAYFYDESRDGAFSLDTVRYTQRAAAGDDNTPPSIKLYFDHRSYRTGDLVGPEPLVIIDVTDSSGVNLTSAMGHGIWLTVGEAKPINLTESFRYQIDNYQSGSLEQRVGPLQPGKYPVKVEAWDSFNNLAVYKSEVEIVAAAGGLVIDRVLNWPNPFNETTALTFTLNGPADFEIKIFTVGGKMIRSFNGRSTLPSGGLVSNIHWDGRDASGMKVGNGVYLYKVIAWDDEGGRADGLGRISFIR